ncbi:MAG: hypothetical protein INR69_13115 [Mucilaginibacter polytrichastri]|nr:hypothetical protein [Mucilaginibacter polytrichastri]
MEQKDHLPLLEEYFHKTREIDDRVRFISKLEEATKAESKELTIAQACIVFSGLGFIFCLYLATY